MYSIKDFVKVSMSDFNETKREFFSFFRGINKSQQTIDILRDETNKLKELLQRLVYENDKLKEENKNLENELMKQKVRFSMLTVFVSKFYIV